MRKIILGLAVTAALAIPASGALASSETENQVSCGSGVASVGVVSVEQENNGVTGCTNGALPIQGRVMVSGDGWAAIDGDADNNPAQLKGWARVDSSGVTCGPDAGGDASQGGGSVSNCG